MGEVIHATFGTEREWEQTHDKTIDGLLTIGTFAVVRRRLDARLSVIGLE